MNNYKYQEGDYHCDRCGVLGDFDGGGTGYDGIERVIICGEVFDGDNNCYCDKCIEIIAEHKNCNHTWEYQPREEDTNIFEHQYCTKCNMIDAGYDENDMGDNSTTSHNFNEGEK